MPGKLKLAKQGALVMHPGPMNRGVEISSEVADGAQSVIQEQVEMGVALRMAVIETLIETSDRLNQKRKGAHMAEASLLLSSPMAHLVDPSQGHDGPASLLIEDGRISAIDKTASKISAPEGAMIINASGHHVFPGLVDMRVHIGEPGSEYRETIASASAAAAAGGVTSFVMMPDTDPVIDEVSLVDYVRRGCKGQFRCAAVSLGCGDQGV